MATYTDDFDRADGALGANWTYPSWEPQTFSIVNQDARPDNSAGAIAYWQGDGTYGRQQRANVTVAGVMTQACDVGSVVYGSDSGCYYLEFSQDNGAAKIYKVDNTGAATQIGLTFAGAATGGQLAVGDTLGLEANDDGSGNTELTIFVNGSNVGSRVDSSSPYTSGLPGMFAGTFGQTGNIEFSSFSAIDYAPAAEDTVTSIVADQAGGALTNQTGITWWWQETAGGSVVDSGTGATTNGSGTMEVSVTNTILSSGQTGYISVELSDGNVGIKKDQVD